MRCAVIHGWKEGVCERELGKRHWERWVNLNNVRRRGALCAGMFSHDFFMVVSFPHLILDHV